MSPLPQLPGLAAFALLGLSGVEGFIALGLGKGVKYSAAAALAARGVGWVRRWPALAGVADAAAEPPRAG